MKSFVLYGNLGTMCDFNRNYRLAWAPPTGERSVDTVVNDSPVDCQSRGVTEPQRDAVGVAD